MVFIKARTLSSIALAIILAFPESAFPICAGLFTKTKSSIQSLPKYRQGMISGSVPHSGVAELDMPGHLNVTQREQLRSYVHTNDGQSIVLRTEMFGALEIEPGALVIMFGEEAAQGAVRTLEVLDRAGDTIPKIIRNSLEPFLARVDQVLAQEGKKMNQLELYVWTEKRGVHPADSGHSHPKGGQAPGFIQTEIGLSPLVRADGRSEPPRGDGELVHAPALAVLWDAWHQTGHKGNSERLVLSVVPIYY